MTSSPPPVRSVVAVFAVLSMTLALFAQDAPSTAQAQSAAEEGSDETLVVRDAEEPAGPGMSSREIRTLDSDGWVHANVLTVDLSDEAVGADLLSPGEVTATGTVDEMVEDQELAAGINADFFDINDTGAAHGANAGRDGVLKNENAGYYDDGAHVAVDAAGTAAALTDVVLDADATIGGEDLDVDRLNVRTVGEDELGVYTPLWGGVPVPSLGDATGVMVADGQVTEVTDDVEDLEVPADGAVVVGRGEAADQLSDVEQDDTADFGFELDLEGVDELEAVVGGDFLLVEDGELADGLDDTDHRTGLHPRSALGIADDGASLMLVTVDGRGDSRGASFRDLAKMMVDLGVDDAVNVDGGGSSTLVARSPGQDPSVQNTPSDGETREVPSGLGISVDAGSGVPDGVTVAPRPGHDGAERVFPGLRRTLDAAAYDDHVLPVEAEATWSADGASVEDGVVVADEPDTTATVTATAGDAQGDLTLDVVGELAGLESADGPVLIGSEDDEATLTLEGVDPLGYRAPVEAADVTLDLDESVAEAETNRDGTFTLTPQTDFGAAIAQVQAAGVSAEVAVQVGTTDEPLDLLESADGWEDPPPTALAVSGELITDVEGPDGEPGLGLAYEWQDADDWGGTQAVYLRADDADFDLPGQPQRLNMLVEGDGHGAWIRAVLVDNNEQEHVVDIGYAEHEGWERLEASLPDGVAFPVALHEIYVVETESDAAGTQGQVNFADMRVALPEEIEADDEQLEPDPFVVEHGALDGADVRIAHLADSQITDGGIEEDLYLLQRSLQEIAEENPDFVLYNGDIVDTIDPGNLELAKQIMDDELGDIPYHVTPGNHEVMGGSETLEEFEEVFGETTQVIDHEGTRFVLLNSAHGTFHGSEMPQLELLRTALDEAAAADAIQGVVVVAHHATRDPNPQDASRLSDALEAELTEEWLTDFRGESGKEVAYLAGHAHVFGADRINGVLHHVVPPAGSKIYGATNRGGFSAWSMVGIDHGAGPREWIQAEIRPMAEGLEIAAPDELAVGDSAETEGTGELTLDRSFPLAYPASVAWTGPGLDTGDGPEGACTIAEFDAFTGILTGVAPGTLELTVTAGADTETVVIEVHGDGEPCDPDPEPDPTPTPTPTPDPEPEFEGVERLSGTGRIETAIAASQERFGGSDAGAVVLARADEYPDALAGTALAASAEAPLLITSSDELVGIVGEEIERVLPDGGTVHLVGGTEALEPAVAQAVESLGYDVERLAGETRFETAGTVAAALDDVSRVLVTTGLDYPDALTAGAAAGANGGAVLLTAGEDPHEVVDGYLDGFGGDVWAVGGPAARAYPDAQGVYGPTRDETAVVVAQELFDEPATFGVAVRTDYPDALAGGAHVAHYGGPLLLTYTEELPGETLGWLEGQVGTAERGYAYGGTDAISDGTLGQIEELFE